MTTKKPLARRQARRNANLTATENETAEVLVPIVGGEKSDTWRAIRTHLKHGKPVPADLWRIFFQEVEELRVRQLDEERIQLLEHREAWCEAALALIGGKND